MSYKRRYITIEFMTVSSEKIIRYDYKFIVEAGPKDIKLIMNFLNNLDKILTKEVINMYCVHNLYKISGGVPDDFNKNYTIRTFVNNIYRTKDVPSGYNPLSSEKKFDPSLGQNLDRINTNYRCPKIIHAIIQDMLYIPKKKDWKDLSITKPKVKAISISSVEYNNLEKVLKVVGIEDDSTLIKGASAAVGNYVDGLIKAVEVIYC